ncbi:hypothetical protein [Virgibacillus doumboii]|uniref:hypothetical protein n=1 Tax=Virgibacillus doumboii TaxID=2697503 RepID=UPI0013E02E4E|nr:hypothetical protein [Virgibacillus doumboii]
MIRIVLVGLVLVIYMIYIGFKHKETWQQLSFSQVLGVVLTFVGVIGAGCFVLFYGVRYLDDLIASDVFSGIVQYFIAFVLLIICVVIYNKIVGKITNGVLPFKRKTKK